VIVSEALVVRHDRQSLGECLGDQHAVEGIIMMPGQPAGGDRVRNADRQTARPPRNRRLA